MLALLSTSTFWVVLSGALLLGVVSGVLGSFALLRRQALLGDALSHAALPGVCLAFLLGGQRKDPLTLLLGALIAAALGALFIVAVVRGSRIKGDAALGIVLSVFFGVGVVLLGYIQKLPSGSKSGLDAFLFGQAATLLIDDVYLLLAVSGLALSAVLLFYRYFALLAFDRDYGVALGLPMRAIEAGLTLLLVVVVVVGLQMVGVVLMVASLLIPAAAARQWTHRLPLMLLIAGLFGGVSAAGGVVLSAIVDKLPTGPMIVLLAGAVFLFSLLFAPGRGLLMQRRRDALMSSAKAPEAPR
ncbi:MAG: zinc transporter [Proteobacteria bacterium]|nr:MAG: zinc transporter [Pseudomonadota bacterium]PIE18592.1 MAG: zinc transporter [Pseudomonadota bacterium]